MGVELDMFYEDNYKIGKCVERKAGGIGIFSSKDDCGPKLGKRDKTWVWRQSLS